MRNRVARCLGVVVLAGSVVGGCDCKHGGGAGSIIGDEGLAQLAPSLNFGNVPVGQKLARTLPLQNSGAGNLQIVSQAISGDATHSFSEVTAFPSSVPVAGSANATLQFAPTQAGPLQATLDLEDDGTTGSAQIQLTGVGVDIQVSVSPAQVDFGPVQIGVQPAPTQQITFTNTGTALALVTVDPSKLPSEFSASDSNGALTGGQQTLGPNGGAYVVTLAFEPDKVATFTSSLGWTGCANTSTCISPQSIPITGSGVTALLQMTPNPVTFSGVPQGSQAQQQITLTNVGANTATLGCVYLKSLGNGQCGQPSSLFSIGSLPATSLASQASMTFQLTYTPSGNPGDADELDVDFTPQGGSPSTATDAILGDGAQTPCSLGIAPPTVNFGTVSVGTPVTQSATLTNAGQSTCNISGVALDPSSDASYSLASGQATSFAINGGASATISATFDLTASGPPSSRRGTIDFQSNDPSHANGAIPLVATINEANPYAGGWPKWHHDNNNSGLTSADTSANSGAVVWKYTGLQSAILDAQNGVVDPGNNKKYYTAVCGGYTYINSPVVADNPTDGGYYVYQLSLDGNLVALDQGGNLLWKTMLSDPTGDPHPSTPAVGKDGNIWVASGSDESGVGALFLVSPSGTILSQQPYGKDGFDACPGLGPDGTLFEADDNGSSSTSSTDKYSAVAFTEDGGQATLLAGLALPLTSDSERFGIVIASDDSSVWGNNGQFFGVTPPAAGFVVSSSWPAAGITLTSNTTDPNAVGPVFSDLAIDPNVTGFAYAYSAWEDGVGHDGGYYGIGQKSGYGWATAPYSVQGTLTAISPSTGATQWSIGLPSAPMPSGWTQLCSDYGNAAPAVGLDGTVYVGNADGLRAIDGATGAQKWLFSSANVSSAPAIGGDGTIFFGCSDGTFYAVSASGGLRFQVAAGAPISTAPAIADDGTVFFVSDDGVLWAVK